MKIVLITLVLSYFYFVTFSQATDEIVLVNVGNLDSAGIAREIAIISVLNPKVISLDLYFPESHKDQNDLLLANTLRQCKNLVVPSLINYTTNGRAILSLGSQWEFVPDGAKSGFISSLYENDQFKTQRNFLISEVNITKNIEYHFSVQTAMNFDSTTTASFIQANHGKTKIEYKDGTRKFKCYSVNDVLDERIRKEDVEGKIVMIGFMGPGDEDKFFTPLNKKVKPYKPDMFGVECLANIVAQVLEWKR